MEREGLISWKRATEAASNSFTLLQCKTIITTLRNLLLSFLDGELTLSFRPHSVAYLVLSFEKLKKKGKNIENDGRKIFLLFKFLKFRPRESFLSFCTNNQNLFARDSQKLKTERKKRKNTTTKNKNDLSLRSHSFTKKKKKKRFLTLLSNYFLHN